MKTATVTGLALLAALPALAGGTPRDTDPTAQTIPAVDRITTSQASAGTAVRLAQQAPQFLQPGLRSELNWTGWSFVSGSNELMYRAADDPFHVCGYIEFRGPVGKTYRVDVYTHEYGNRHSSKETLTVILRNSTYGTRAWRACIDEDSASLAE